MDGIKERKGYNIVLIELTKIKNSPCSFFVICSATSKTQINAIADNIKRKVLKNLDVKIWKEEGRNSNWRLLDYGDLVIHILKEEMREYYQLEELWGDGDIKKIE